MIASRRSSTRITFLLDVNVWLALAFDTHTHHPSALAWFDELVDEACVFCRLTQQGFLRLANNPKAFPDDAVTSLAAWQLYGQALSDPRVSYLAEPPGLEAVWRRFTESRRFTPRLWNDAYLAAFAQAGGYEIITFDQGFVQYGGTAVTILK